ncbi:MAG: L-threonylcarbamoyladenylate synthase [Rikenellaceae bacterium]
MGEIIKLYDKGTSPKQLFSIVEKLQKGAIMIYPTDTTYALGCSLNCIKSINELKKLKNKEDDNLTIICNDISNVTSYARVDNAVFKLIKRNTPAAITFILHAASSVPNAFLYNKKSVGVRIPNNPITLALVEALGVPLVSTSLPLDANSMEGDDEVSLIWEKYKNLVDIMIDGGEVPNVVSTIVDLSQGEIEIIREGAVEIIY